MEHIPTKLSVGGKLCPICTLVSRKNPFHTQRLDSLLKSNNNLWLLLIGRSASGPADCSRTQPHVCASRRQLPPHYMIGDFRAPLSFCGRKQRGTFCDNESDLPDTGCVCAFGLRRFLPRWPPAAPAQKRRRKKSALVSAILALVAFPLLALRDNRDRPQALFCVRLSRRRLSIKRERCCLRCVCLSKIPFSYFMWRACQFAWSLFASHCWCGNVK